MSTINEFDIIRNINTKNYKTKNETISQKETHHDSTIKKEKNVMDKLGTDRNYKHEIKWLYVLRYFVYQVFAIWGVYLVFTAASWKSVFFTIVLSQMGVYGITVGAHRCYAHKSYKASFFLRILLMICQTGSAQDSIYKWTRDHRLHHKYSDTDADPYSAERGFFFAHGLWLIYKKHPLVIEKGKEIDMSDLIADPITRFQLRHYQFLYRIMVILYIGIPMYFWNESFKVAFLCCYILSSAYVLHVISSVNSVAHYFGTKPFDKNIRPVETIFVSIMTNGEGWHNYHHAFPRDYRASEFGASFNMAATLIEFFAYLGLASDLKTAPEGSIRHRSIKHGDGTHPVYGNMRCDPEMMKHLTQDFGMPTEKRDDY